jgi:23S rRNA-intervening sequence protein
MLEARSWMEGDDKKVIGSYRDLRIYQRSYQAALEVHRLTREFPEFERRELGSQLRRSSTSIPVNIA